MTQAVRHSATKPPEPRVLEEKLPTSFYIFLAGSFLSNIGTWMQMVGQVWLVAELSKEPFWTGVVGFCSGAPMLLLSLVGGTIADRFDRRKMLFLSQTVLMLVAAVLAYMTLSGKVSIFWIAVLALFTGTATAMSLPAYHSFIYDIVGMKHVTRAVSLNASQLHFARMMGPAIAGFVLSFIGAGACFALNAVSFLAVLPPILLVRATPHDSSHARSAPFLKSLGEAIQYVISHRATRISLSITALISILLMPHLTLMALFVKEYLHLGPRTLSGIWVASGLGAVVASFYVAKFGMPFKERPINFLLGGALFSGISLLVLSELRHPLGLYVATFAVGLGVGFVSVGAQNLLQTTVTPQLRGRVFGLWGTLFQGLFPVGNLLVASLAQAINIPNAWKVASLLMIGLTTLSIALGLRSTQKNKLMQSS
jgi:MFS family permease